MRWTYSARARCRPGVDCRGIGRCVMCATPDSGGAPSQVAASGLACEHMRRVPQNLVGWQMCRRALCVQSPCGGGSVWQAGATFVSPHQVDFSFSQWLGRRATAIPHVPHTR